MSNVKTLGTVDYLGLQAMFFPTKVVGGTKYFFADRYWMVEIRSRRFGFRSFNRIDHLPQTVVIAGRVIPVDSLSLVGTRLMFGSQVVGSLGSNGVLTTLGGSPIVSEDGAGVLSDRGAGVLGDRGAGVLGDRGAGVLGDRGAGVLSDRGAGFSRTG